MRWWLIPLFLMLSVFATYTADSYNSIQSTFRTSYTADSYDNILLVFGEDEGLYQFVIWLSAPENETQIVGDPTPQFNFTVNGTASCYFCELFINGTGFGTNSSVFNDTLTSIDANSTVSIEWHEWYINCTNGTFTNSSETWLFNTSYANIEFLYSGTWCYQETANATSVCGGLDTGVYAFTEDWIENNLTGFNLTYDENWTSGGEPNANKKAFFFVNYTKPTAISSQSRDWNANDYSLWMVKDGSAGNEEERNLTMDYACWHQNPLQFRVELNGNGSVYFMDYSCWEGSSWVNLYNRTGADVGPILYEEAMYWYAGCRQLEYGVWLGENGMTNATYQTGESQCLQIKNNGTETGYPACRVNQTVYGLVPQISTSYNFNCVGGLCHNLTTDYQYIYSAGPVNTSMAVDDTLDCYFRWYYNSSYSFPNTNEIDCIMEVTG